MVTLADIITRGIHRDAFDYREIYNDFDGIQEFEHEADDYVVTFSIEVRAFPEIDGIDYSATEVFLESVVDAEGDEVEDKQLLDQIHFNLSQELV